LAVVRVIKKETPCKFNLHGVSFLRNSLNLKIGLKHNSHMEYTVKAHSFSKTNALIEIKQSSIDFGITPETADSLPNPAELFLGSFSSCILKNVERFSVLMHFEYTTAEISVKATRLEKPPRMDEINYVLKVHSKDKNLNIELLKKNIEKFGTIYNTVKLSCTINGTIEKISE
tara:strand:+ start:3693 stop:4211 length:519 start_codon:yes stop_codon:yes gene_type:complete